MITHSDALIATPINLGSSEMVSINTLLTKIEKVAGVKMNHIPFKGAADVRTAVKKRPSKRASWARRAR